MTNQSALSINYILEQDRKAAMVSAVSGSTQATQYLSGSTSSKPNVAALEKEIAAKETEAQENKDPVKAASIAAELASLRAELAKLKAADRKSEVKETESSGSALQQAGLVSDTSDEKPGFWV